MNEFNGRLEANEVVSTQFLELDKVNTKLNHALDMMATLYEGVATYEKNSTPYDCDRILKNLEKVKTLYQELDKLRKEYEYYIGTLFKTMYDYLKLKLEVGKFQEN